MEQPFWNTYPVYTLDDKPNEGNLNVNDELPPQNVNDDVVNVHASPVRNIPPVQNVINSPAGIHNAIDAPNLQDYVLARVRTRRTNVKKPVKFDGYVGLVALINSAFNVYESYGDKPQSYKQAAKSKF